MRIGPRRLTVHLAAFAAAILVPAALLSAYALHIYIEEEQAELRQVRFASNERALKVVDEVVERRLALVRALATSPVLDGRPDIARFREQVRALSPDAAIALIDAATMSVVTWAGRPVVQDAALDRENLAALLGGGRRTAEGAVLSDLVHPERGKDALLAVAAPAGAGGGPTHVVLAVLHGADLAPVMTEEGVTAPFYASLVDGRGRIIARSDPAEQRTGELLPGFDSVGKGRQEWEGVNPQGVPVLGTFRRSDLTGWYVTVGVAREALEAPLRRSLLAFAQVSALVLAVIAFAVYLVSAPFRRTCRDLLDAVEAMSFGRRIEIATVPITEANQIGRALADASDRLATSRLLLLEANETLERRVAERTDALSAALSKAEIAERAAREASIELARLATTDALTGLSNRRMFNAALEAEWLSARMRGTPLALLIIDVDHFKVCNDTYGHAVGDDLLRAVGQSLQLGLRDPGDQLFRIGGEEFAVLLSDTDEAEARDVAVHLHAAVSGAAVPDAGIQPGRTTVSIGLAMSAYEAESASAHLFRRADAALYEAKRAGRNRTVAAGRTATTSEPRPLAGA